MHNAFKCVFIALVCVFAVSSVAMAGTEETITRLVQDGACIKEWEKHITNSQMIERDEIYRYKYLLAACQIAERAPKLAANPVVADCPKWRSRVAAMPRKDELWVQHGAGSLARLAVMNPSAISGCTMRSAGVHTSKVSAFCATKVIPELEHKAPKQAAADLSTSESVVLQCWHECHAKAVKALSGSHLRSQHAFRTVASDLGLTLGDLFFCYGNRW